MSKSTDGLVQELKKLLKIIETKQDGHMFLKQDPYSQARKVDIGMESYKEGEFLQNDDLHSVNLRKLLDFISRGRFDKFNKLFDALQEESSISWICEQFMANFIPNAVNSIINYHDEEKAALFFKSFFQRYQPEQKKYLEASLFETLNQKEFLGTNFKKIEHIFDVLSELDKALFEKVLLCDKSHRQLTSVIQEGQKPLTEKIINQYNKLDSAKITELFFTQDSSKMTLLDKVILHSRRVSRLPGRDYSGDIIFGFLEGKLQERFQELIDSSEKELTKDSYQEYLQTKPKPIEKVVFKVGASASESDEEETPPVSGFRVVSASRETNLDLPQKL